MTLVYRTADLGRGAAPDPGLVRPLQRDLRALGYLRRGIDGLFGSETRTAIRALQFDLLHNDGRSTGADGDAPVAMTSFNHGVAAVTGVADDALVDSIEALLGDERVTKLPSCTDPTAANRAALAEISRLRSRLAPVPFMLAMFMQESHGQHYAVPERVGDEDTYITLGLDREPSAPDRITSRGYGIGQYTIYHHPPRASELADFVVDPLRNTDKAFEVLADKFAHFVLGANGAYDHDAEHKLLTALRICRYGPGDSRYMNACWACASAVRRIDIAPTSPVYAGARETYGQAPHYRPTTYRGVPDRAEFLCDWPYAARRYNGGGPDSFNYQAIVLCNLLLGGPPAPVA